MQGHIDYIIKRSVGSLDYVHGVQQGISNNLQISWDQMVDYRGHCNWFTWSQPWHLIQLLLMLYHRAAELSAESWPFPHTWAALFRVLPSSKCLSSQLAKVLLYDRKESNAIPPTQRPGPVLLSWARGHRWLRHHQDLNLISLMIRWVLFSGASGTPNNVLDTAEK